MHIVIFDPYPAGFSELSLITEDRNIPNSDLLTVSRHEEKTTGTAENLNTDEYMDSLFPDVTTGASMLERERERRVEFI